MDEENRITDAQLHALLDGELSAEQEARIRALLASDPAAQQQLNVDRALTERLRAALEPISREPIPSRLLLATGGRPRVRVWLGGGLAAGLALGLLGGWWLAGVEQTLDPPVVRSAVSAHAVYLPEVRHPVEVTAAQSQHLNTWLSKRLGHELAAPDLRTFGLALVGGRLLPDAGTPAAQFMYEGASGARLTIYCRLEDHERESALRFAQVGDTRLFHWVEHGMSYAVVAGMDRAALRPVAEAVHQQL